MKIELDTKVEAPDLAEADLLRYAEEAKKGCPVSKALAAVPEMRLQAHLVK